MLEETYLQQRPAAELVHSHRRKQGADELEGADCDGGGCVHARIFENLIRVVEHRRLSRAAGSGGGGWVRVGREGGG